MGKIKTAEGSNVEVFDAVVVGSGFGGAVAAYRLAEAGLHTCVLERGQAYPPGSFPRTPHELSRSFWDPSEGHYGIYNIWSFAHLDSVVASGLGGGSLIYANVLLRKDERWFVTDDPVGGAYRNWPVTRADLDPHYDHVEKMLGATPFPFDHEPYASNAKTAAMKRAAEELHLDWSLPNLAITFGNSGEAPRTGDPIREAHPNLHDRIRYTCRLTGECCFGCNYGSKNTLDYNYLSEAVRLGAEIRTLCEVRTIAPADGSGFHVQFVRHDLERAGQKTDTHNSTRLPLRTLLTRRLVLAAGTYGTNFLLMKNRGAFPLLSSRLGERFGANGDFLAAILNCGGRNGRQSFSGRIEADRGPVITSAIRLPDARDGGHGRGFYLEDMGYPAFLSWVINTFGMLASAGVWEQFVRTLLRRFCAGNRNADVGGEIGKLLGAAEPSAKVLPMIGIGRDFSDARIHLNRGKLDVDWSITKAEAQYFGRARTIVDAIAGALGGRAINPLQYLDRTVTMHPLGGCAMGNHVEDGVVDSYGEVFNYPGFYIADGSVLPAAVGVNPSLTIAALANRFSERIADRRGLT